MQHSLASLFLLIVATYASSIYDCEPYNFDECVDAHNRPQVWCGEAGYCQSFQGCVWCKTTNETASCISAPKSCPVDQDGLRATCPAGFIESRNTMDCNKQNTVATVVLSIFSIFPAGVYARSVGVERILQFFYFAGMLSLLIVMIVVKHDIFIWGMLLIPALCLPLIAYAYRRWWPWGHRPSVQNTDLEVQLLPDW